jgi:hypothetical protein
MYILNAAMIDARRHDTLHLEVFRLAVEIERSIGYGGLIHDFKNFILRGAPHYRERVIERAAYAQEALQRLEELVEPIAEIDVDPVIAAIRAYRENVDVAQKALERGEIPCKTDNLVKVDDSQAILALERALERFAEAAIRRRAALLSEERAMLGISILLLVGVCAIVLEGAILRNNRRNTNV